MNKETTMTDTKLIVTKLEAIKAKYDAIKAEYDAVLESVEPMIGKVMAEAFAPVFEKYPKLQAIRWNQYTPYFNDGDACYFSAHNPEVNLFNEDEDCQDEDDFNGFYSGLLTDDERKAMSADINAVYNILDEYQKEKLFGDGVRVYFRRAEQGNLPEFETEEYDHD
jgi:hypothetical protein